MEDYLLNITPIDGRYYSMSEEVKNYFSEYQLIKNRIIVEIEWLKKLANINEIDLKLNNKEIEILDRIKNEFNLMRSKRG